MAMLSRHGAQPPRNRLRQIPMRAPRCYLRGSERICTRSPMGRCVPGGMSERGVPVSVEGGHLSANDGHSTAPLRAVVLAGGLGTRLRPYTTIIPKPLVPIGDRPVLEHIIRSLGRCGVDRIDLCVSHLGQLIRVYLAHADLPVDLRLSFCWESEPLGTAGALLGVPDLEGTFIVM